MADLDPKIIPFLAGALGAISASLSGRERTRLDNAIIGGLFTGFAAYRDPRSTATETLLTAAVEGAVWGIADRIVPAMKELLLPTTPLASALERIE